VAKNISNLIKCMEISIWEAQHAKLWKTTMWLEVEEGGFYLESSFLLIVLNLNVPKNPDWLH
jgi:hypothetical protein